MTLAKPSNSITRLLGKRIHRVVGYLLKANCVPADAILFDDGSTFIDLEEEQDPYTYHDCSTGARYIDVRENKQEWAYLNSLQDATELT